MATGKDADRITKDMVNKARSGKGTLTYTPNTTGRAAEKEMAQMEREAARPPGKVTIKKMPSAPKAKYKHDD
jgi:hypothetical protein